MLREDLRNGSFYTGQRLVELELAAHYGVSRTPVREALFQLAREGLITDSDRGYSLPIDTHDDFLDRLAVRRGLDPLLAAHAAQRATPAQVRELELLLERMRAAHEAGDFKEFSNHAHLFRLTLIEAAHNVALDRVCRVLEDQFLIMRNKQYHDVSNRALAVQFEAKLCQAIKQSDPDKAAQVAREYMEAVIRIFGESVEDTSRPWIAPRQRHSDGTVVG
ncbi:HTH-type transcriptional repressor RspR [Pandoraea terrigena]|uniref:HTH-type transcriptional repressor RspR n=2 Tax=Pandoraea terrigena TaxID=2508292 RepID=A0A5E4VF60_9BURK|nr:HTH-type transcriptional repressor RspR [Pandoraea terrigena]